MAVNPNNLLGQSNPNGTVGVSLGIDPAGANEAFSAGATSGFYVTPTSPAGMSVQVGGAVGVIDSALVRSASGITFPVGNVTGTPITLTVPAAPSTNSRIDSVVLYVDTSVTATVTDGANAVGIEIVSGTSASTPVAPTDAQIRSAITNGAAIAYTVLADITVSSSTTTITASNISQANRAQLAADKIDLTTLESEDFRNKVTFNIAAPANVTFRKTGNLVQFSYQGNSTTYSANQTVLTIPVGYRPKTSANQYWFVGSYNADTAVQCNINVSSGVLAPSIASGGNKRLYVAGSYFTD